MRWQQRPERFCFQSIAFPSCPNLPVVYYFLPLPWIVGWGLKAKSWWIDSAVAKFIAFGHTFAMKIIFSPQKRFSSPWVFVWKPENPHYGVKNQSCRKLYIWVSKPIRRKIQNQWKKLELNRAYQLREKSKKNTREVTFWKLYFCALHNYWGCNSSSNWEHFKWKWEERDLGKRGRT